MPVNLVVDICHYNGTVDLSAAAAAGILGVIHKATQGMRYQDPLYASNCSKAPQAGLLWGACHSGDGSDGAEQADAFLAFVKPTNTTLLILDFEANPQGPSMNLEEARVFITYVRSATGRWPGLYAGYYLKQLIGTQKDPVLSNCWLWLSQYGRIAVAPQN